MNCFWQGTACTPCILLKIYEMQVQNLHHPLFTPSMKTLSLFLKLYCQGKENSQTERIFDLYEHKDLTWKQYTDP